MFQSGLSFLSLLLITLTLLGVNLFHHEVNSLSFPRLQQGEEMGRTGGAKPGYDCNVTVYNEYLKPIYEQAGYEYSNGTARNLKGEEINSTISDAKFRNLSLFLAEMNKEGQGQTRSRRGAPNSSGRHRDDYEPFLDTFKDKERGYVLARLMCIGDWPMECKELTSGSTGGTCVCLDDGGRYQFIEEDNICRVKVGGPCLPTDPIQVCQGRGSGPRSRKRFECIDGFCSGGAKVMGQGGRLIVILRMMMMVLTSTVLFGNFWNDSSLSV